MVVGVWRFAPRLPRVLVPTGAHCFTGVVSPSPPFPNYSSKRFFSVCF